MVARDRQKKMTPTQRRLVSTEHGGEIGRLDSTHGVILLLDNGSSMVEGAFPCGSQFHVVQRSFVIRGTPRRGLLESCRHVVRRSWPCADVAQQ